jgi:hypothetical protein
VSIVAAEELARIAAELGLDRVEPAWLGASVLVEGIPDFSHLPPSSRLQGPDGVTLTVDMQNRPCMFPAKTIDDAHPGKGKRFKEVALGLRGRDGLGGASGVLRIGDALRSCTCARPARLGASRRGARALRRLGAGAGR